MDHDSMDVHAEILRIIDEQVSPDGFFNAIESIAAEHGEQTYSELMAILASINVEPAEGHAMWIGAWEHRKALSDTLGRPVNISVALLDYVLSSNDKYIHRAKVIDIWDYERVAQSAIRDGLTGLFNPGYIREQVSWELEKDLRYKKGGTIVIFDLNKFKQCNDEYGHLAGDAVLREFATILKDHTRRTDAVGRYGGDEFLVLMPATPMEGAFVVADRIRRNLEETAVRVPSAPPEGIRITTTGGIAQYGTGTRNTLEELVDAADKALYLGKRDGANRVYTEWTVSDKTIALSEGMIEEVTVMASDSKHQEPIETIGNRTLTFVSRVGSLTEGDVFSCTLKLPDRIDIFPCYGQVTQSIDVDGVSEDVHFRPIQTDMGDWSSINRFIILFERMNAVS
jgi:diguanylate cyclase (GGDEF)-like protein